jgi:hypothetical protein
MRSVSTSRGRLMKFNSLDELRREMGAIFDSITAIGSTPRAIMEANKLNSSKEWDEKGDARRFDDAVPDAVKSFDRAVNVLIKR